MNRQFALITVSLIAFANAAHAALSDAELERIGKRVWQNECGGTREGLTSWNVGEDFASLGIGHFIWYVEGKRGPFEESFPPLTRFLAENGVKVPDWMRGACPWRSRAEFQGDLHSAPMNELRDLLAATIRLQSRFLAGRMEAALPKMLRSAPAAQRDNIRIQFQRLTATGPGTFALIDYVNFKGEGTKLEERYNGEGWGLLQVLSGMKGSGGGGPAECSRSAIVVLERRVQNSPPARNEARWLPGWKSRVRSYAE